VLVNYRVGNLDNAIQGQKIIDGPSSVGNGFMRVASIEFDGAILELLEYANPGETGWFL
jgi:hypothetical protein